jgi:hypothetical protein
MIHITTLPEFEMLIAGTGYITITDKPTKAVKVHAVNCPHVSKANFTKKVIENKEENGHYYWMETVKEAISELQAEPCLVCR